MGIYFAHEVNLDEVRFVNDRLRFAVDWIAYHGKLDLLTCWLSDEEGDDGEEIPGVIELARNWKNEDCEGRPMWTEDMLEGLLMEDDERPSPAFFAIIGIPYPTEEQMKNLTMPNGWRRTHSVSTHSPDLHGFKLGEGACPLSLDRINLQHLTACSFEFCEKVEGDAK